MDLHALAWMVRDAGQPVGCGRLLDDHRVLAGGWDGEVRCWDAETRVGRLIKGRMVGEMLRSRGDVHGSRIVPTRS